MAASTIEIGKLRAILGMDTAQYESGARKAVSTNAQLAANMKLLQGQVAALGGPMGQATARFAAMGAAAGALSGTLIGSAMRSGIQALVRLGEEAITTAGNLVDMSARTGISIESLQRMDFVAGQTGATLEQFTRAAFQLGVRLNSGSGSVAGAVKDLGLNLKDLRAMRPEDMFAAVMDAAAGFTNEAQRNEIMVRLFGRAAQAILPAAAEGYKKLAAEARAAGDAQVFAIDKAADAWAGFMKTVQTGAIELGGSFALGLEALGKMTAMERMQFFILAGGTNPLESIIRLGKERATVLAEQANAQKEADAATKTAVVTDTNYAKQLVEVRKQLASLTPEQRKQIDAGLALGISTEKLEDELGLMPGLLTQYKTAMKGAAESDKDKVQAQKELRESLADVTGEILDSNTKLEGVIDKALVDTERERLDVIEDMIDAASVLEEKLDALMDKTQKEIEREAEDWANFQRQLSEQGHLGSIRERNEETKRAIRNTEMEWQRMVDGMTFSITNGFADMLVGLRGFKDGFIGIWDDIRRSVANILSQMLADFIGGYVRRAMAAAAGIAVAGGGGSAVAAAATGAGGVAGLAGGGAGLLALATNPFTIAAAAGIGLGVAISKGFLRGGEEAAQVNPRRDRFFGQFGGSGQAAALLKSNQLMRGLFAADTLSEWQSAQSAAVMRFEMMGRKVQSFETGGVIPPGVVQPAILHGGTHGEVVMPLDKAAARGTVVNNYWNISALDGQSVLRVVKEQIAPALTHMERYNIDGFTTQRKLALGIR